MRTFVFRVSIVIAVFVAVTCATGQPLSDAPIAIVNVNVVPLDRDAVLTAQTVIVRNGTITHAGKDKSVQVPPEAHAIDGTGKYLMPGIVDAHVHLSSNPEDQQRDILTMFVANGVTTVVNLRGTPQMLELRSNVAAGHVLGPTIFTAGPYINEPFVTTPEQVEAAVVEQRRAGYDFIKMHGDLSREAYRRLNAVARREGIRVIGHAPRNLGIAAMFEERPYAVAHAEEFIYDERNSSRNFAAIEPLIPALARSMVDAGIWLMPNLTAFDMIGRQIQDLRVVLARPEMRYLPREVRDLWGPATNGYTTRFSKDQYPGFLARYELLEKLTRGFQAGGVRLLLGSDAMNTGTVPGFSAHDELTNLVRAGLTPFEALQAATVNGAAFLANGSQRGAIAPGQKADLILLDANPLEDIANTRRIEGVMLRGRWLSKADIVRMLNDLEN